MISHFVTLRSLGGFSVARRGMATAGSVFGDLSSAQKAPETAPKQPPAEDIKPENVTIENDVQLQEYLNPKPILSKDSLLSPLKKQLYQLNVAKNGFFKNGTPLKLNGDQYEMKLSREEIEALEPSVLLRSWRIKSSVKKTNIVLRALKGLPLKKAITQCHFMEKKVSNEIAEMLQRGVKDAEAMNYDVNKLYVDQLWVHTDGQWVRRVEWKGRGRMGVLTHRYVSIRILLKSEQTTKRIKFEENKREMNKKVENKVNLGKIKGSLPGFYRW